jgi:hypothetical protein
MSSISTFPSPQLDVATVRKLLLQDFKERVGKSPLVLFKLSEPLPAGIFESLPEPDSAEVSQLRPELNDLKSIQHIFAPAQRRPFADLPVVSSEAARRAAAALFPYLDKVEFPEGVALCGGAAEAILSMALLTHLESSSSSKADRPPAKKLKQRHGQASLPMTPLERVRRQGDLDFFFHGHSTVEDASKCLMGFARSFADKCQVSGEDTDNDALWNRGKVVSLHVVTAPSEKIHDLQFILRKYGSLAEILNGFDFGSCQVAFDGKDLYVTRLGLVAQQFGFNLVDSQRRSLSYEYRLEKYAGDRGYGFVVPFPELLLDETDACVSSSALKLAAVRSTELNSAEPTCPLFYPPFAVSTGGASPDSVLVLDKTLTDRLFPREPLSDYDVVELERSWGMFWDLATVSATANVKVLRAMLLSRAMDQVTNQSANEFDPKFALDRLHAYYCLSDEPKDIDPRSPAVFSLSLDELIDKPSQIIKDGSRIRYVRFLSKLANAKGFANQMRAFMPREGEGGDELYRMLESKNVGITSELMDKISSMATSLVEHIHAHPECKQRELTWIVENPGSQTSPLSSSFNPCFSTFQLYAENAKH